MSLEQLSERYAQHNRTERGRGFIFAGPERETLFRRYVGGPGRRVLDLGCRDGALTQAYVGGNEVVGVDADREALAEAQERAQGATPRGQLGVVLRGEVVAQFRFPELHRAVPGGVVLRTK